MDSISLFSQNSARSMSPRTQTRNLSGPSSPKLRRTFNLFKTARFPNDVVEIPKKPKIRSQSDANSFDSLSNFSLSSSNFYTDTNDEANSSILYSNLDDSAQNVKNEYLQVLSSVSDTLNHNNTPESKKSDSKMLSNLLPYSSPEHQKNQFLLDKIIDSDSESLPNPVFKKIIDVDIDSDTCKSDPITHKKLYETGYFNDKSNEMPKLEIQSNEQEDQKSDDSLVFDDKSSPNILYDNDDNKNGTNIVDNSNESNKELSTVPISKANKIQPDSKASKNENFSFFVEKESTNDDDNKNDKLNVCKEEEEDLDSKINSPANDNEEKFIEEEEENSDVNENTLNNKETKEGDEIINEDEENSYSKNKVTFTNEDENSNTNNIIVDKITNNENKIEDKEEESDTTKRITNEKEINNNNFMEEGKAHSDANNSFLNDKSTNDEENSKSKNNIVSNKASINEDDFAEEENLESNNNILDNEASTNKDKFNEEEENLGSNNNILDNEASTNKDNFTEEEENQKSRNITLNKEVSINVDEIAKEEENLESNNNKFLSKEASVNEKEFTEEEENPKSSNIALKKEVHINEDKFAEEENLESNNNILTSKTSTDKDKFTEEEENPKSCNVALNNEVSINENEFTEEENLKSNNNILTNEVSIDKDKFTEEEENPKSNNNILANKVSINKDNFKEEEENLESNNNKFLSKEASANEEKSTEEEENPKSSNITLKKEVHINEDKFAEEENLESNNNILTSKTSTDKDKFTEEEENPKSCNVALNNEVSINENEFTEDEEKKNSDTTNSIFNNKEKPIHDEEIQSDTISSILGNKSTNNENEFNEEEENTNSNNNILSDKSTTNEFIEEEDEDNCNSNKDIANNKSNDDEKIFTGEEEEKSDATNSLLINQISSNENDFNKEEEQTNGFLNSASIINNADVFVEEEEDEYFEEKPNILHDKTDNNNNEEEFLNENSNNNHHFDDFKKPESNTKEINENFGDFFIPDQLAPSHVNREDEIQNDIDKKEDLNDENNLIYSNDNNETFPLNSDMNKKENDNSTIINDQSNVIQVIEKNITSNEITPDNFSSNDINKEHNEELIDDNSFDGKDDNNNDSNSNTDYNNNNNHSHNETNNDDNDRTSNNNNDSNNVTNNNDDSSNNINNNNENNNNNNENDIGNNSNLNETEFIFPISPVFMCPPLFERTIRNTIKITTTSNYSPTIKLKVEHKDNKVDGTSLMRKSNYFEDYNGILTFVKTEHPEFSDEPPFKDFDIKYIRETIGWGIGKDESKDLLSDDSNFNQQQAKIDKNDFSSDYNEFDDFDDFRPFNNNDDDTSDLKKEKMIFRSRSILSSDFLSTDIEDNDYKFFRSSSVLSSDIFLSDYEASDLSLSSDDDEIIFDANYPAKTNFQNVNIEKIDSPELKSQQNPISNYHDDQLQSFNICQIIYPNFLINATYDDYLLESDKNDFQIHCNKYINKSTNEFKIDELRTIITPTCFSITFFDYVDHFSFDLFNQHKQDYFDKTFLFSFKLETKTKSKVPKSSFISNLPETKHILSTSNDKFSVLQQQDFKIPYSNFYIDCNCNKAKEDSFFIEINDEEQEISNTLPSIFTKDEYKSILLEDSILIDEYEFLNIEECGIDENYSLEDDFVSTHTLKETIEEDSFKIIKGQMAPIIKTSDFNVADFSMKELNNYLIKDDKYLHVDFSYGSSSIDVLKDKQHFNVSNLSNYKISDGLLCHKIKSENYKQLYDDIFSIPDKDQVKYKMSENTKFIDAFPFKKRFDDAFKIVHQMQKFSIQIPPKSFYNFIPPCSYLVKDNAVFISDETYKNSVKSEPSLITCEKWVSKVSDTNDKKEELISKTAEYHCNELVNKNGFYVKKQINTKFLQNENDFKINDNEARMCDKSPILSSEHHQDNPRSSSFISNSSSNYKNENISFISSQSRKNDKLIKTEKEFSEFQNREPKVKMPIFLNFKSNINDSRINQNIKSFTLITSSCKPSPTTFVSNYSSKYKDCKNDFISTQDDFKHKLNFEFFIKEHHGHKSISSINNEFNVSNNIVSIKENSFIPQSVHQNPTSSSSFSNDFSNFAIKYNEFISTEAKTNQTLPIDQEINKFNNIEFDNRIVSSNKHKTETHDNFAVCDPISFNSTKIISNPSKSLLISNESNKYTNKSSKYILIYSKYKHQATTHDKELNEFKNEGIESNKYLPSANYKSDVHDISIKFNENTFRVKDNIANPAPNSFTSNISNELKNKTNLFVSTQEKYSQHTTTERISNEFQNKVHDSNKYFPSTKYTSNVRDNSILQDENAFYSNEINNKSKSLSFNHNNFKVEGLIKEEYNPIPKLISIVHHESLKPKPTKFNVNNNLICTNKENIFNSKVIHVNPTSSSSFITNNSYDYLDKCRIFKSTEDYICTTSINNYEFKNTAFDRNSISQTNYKTTFHDNFTTFDSNSFHSIKSGNNTISSSSFITIDAQNYGIKNNPFISNQAPNNQLTLTEKNINIFKNNKFEVQKSVSKGNNTIKIHDNCIVKKEDDFDIKQNLINPASYFILNDSCDYINKANTFISIQTSQKLQIKDEFQNKELLTKKSIKMQINKSNTEKYFIKPKSIIFDSTIEIKNPTKSSFISNNTTQISNKSDLFISKALDTSVIIPSADYSLTVHTGFKNMEDDNSFLIEPSPYFSKSSEFKIKSGNSANKHQVNKFICKELHTNGIIPPTDYSLTVHSNFTNIEDANSFISKPSPYLSKSNEIKIENENAKILANKHKIDKSIKKEFKTKSIILSTNYSLIVNACFTNKESENSFLIEPSPYLSNSIEFKTKSKNYVDKHQMDKFVCKELDNGEIIPSTDYYLNVHTSFKNKDSQNSFLLKSSPYLSQNYEFKIESTNSIIPANKQKISESIKKELKTKSIVTSTDYSLTAHTGFKNKEDEEFLISGPYLSNNFEFKIKSRNSTNKHQINKLVCKELETNAIIPPTDYSLMVHTSFKNKEYENSFISAPSPYLSTNDEIKIENENYIILANKHKIDKFIYNDILYMPKSLNQESYKTTDYDSFHPSQAQYLSKIVLKNENFMISPNKQKMNKFIHFELTNDMHALSKAHKILNHELPKNDETNSFQPSITQHLSDKSKFISKNAIYSDLYVKTLPNEFINKEFATNKSVFTNNYKILIHENFQNLDGNSFHSTQSQYFSNEPQFNSKNEFKDALSDKQILNEFIYNEFENNNSIPLNNHSVLNNSDFKNADQHSFQLKSIQYISDNFMLNNDKNEDNSVSKSSFISNIELFNSNNNNEIPKSHIMKPFIQVESLKQKGNEKKIIHNQNNPMQNQFSSSQNEKEPYSMKSNEFISSNSQNHSNLLNSQFKTISNDFCFVDSFNSLPSNQISNNKYKIPDSEGSFKPRNVKARPVVQRSVFPDSFNFSRSIEKGKSFTNLAAEPEINSSNLFKKNFEDDYEEYTEEEIDDNNVYPSNYYNLNMLRSDYEEDEEENKNEYSEIIRFGEINAKKREIIIEEKPKLKANQFTQTNDEKAYSTKSDVSIQSNNSTSKKSTKSKRTAVKKSPQSQQSTRRIRRIKRIIKKKQREADQTNQKESVEKAKETVRRKQANETEQVRIRQSKANADNQNKRNEIASNNQHKTNTSSHRQHQLNEKVSHNSKYRTNESVSSISSHQRNENIIKHQSKESPSNNSNHRRNQLNDSASNSSIYRKEKSISNHQNQNESVSSISGHQQNENISNHHHHTESVSSISGHQQNENISNHRHQKVKIKLKSRESEQAPQSILKKSDNTTKTVAKNTKHSKQEINRKPKQTQSAESSESIIQQQQNDHHVKIQETEEKAYEIQIKNFVTNPSDNRLRSEMNMKISFSSTLNDNDEIIQTKPYVIHKKDQITYKMFYRQAAFPLVPSENEFFAQLLEQISQQLRVNRQFSSLIEMIDQYLIENDSSYIDLYPLNTSILIDRYPLILGELIETRRNGEKLKEMSKKCKLLINGTFLVICSPLQTKVKNSKKSNKNNESESSEKKVVCFAVKNCTIKETKNKKSLIVKSNDTSKSGFLNQNCNELKLSKNEIEYVDEIELKSNNKEVISEWILLNNKLRDKRSIIEYYLSIIAYYSFYDLNSNRFDKIKEFDDGSSVKSTVFEITYETIEKAVISPNLYLTLFLLNQLNPNKKIVSFVFKLFVNSNRHDFLIRTLFLSEVSTTSPDLVFQIQTVYNRSLLTLFTSPSIDWMTSFVQKVENVSISPSIFLKMLLKEMNSMPQESLYIIRSILILSLLVYGDNISTFKIFILFVKNAISGVISNMNTVRTIQSFFSQIHIKIGNPSNKEFERLNNFVQLMLMKTPKLSNKFIFKNENKVFEEFNIPQICQLILNHIIENDVEFLKFIENRIQNLNEEKKRREDFHPLLFSFYQNIRFYMNFQYKYQLSIHE